jgi:cell division protein FtsI/penicillin-binding protein 2
MAVVDRRIGLLFGAFLLLLTVAVFRAGYLGLFRAGQLQQAAKLQQVSNEPIPAQRGEITDRNGQILALSEAADEVIADPLLIARTPGESAATVARLLAPLTGKSVALLTAKLSEMKGYVPLAYVPAAAGAEIKQLRVGKLPLNGISETAMEQRVYPRGDEAAQVIGFVNGAGNGASGIEYMFNRVLHGVAGERRIVNDAQGQAISVGTPRPMVPGKTISLTISAPLQSEVEAVIAQVAREYSPTGITAIVTDPQTDQILALANWPFLNPNDVAASPQAAQADQAVLMSYEPGSTFKAATVGGALMDGVVTPSTVIPVPAELDPYGFPITDAEAHGNEALTVAQILKVSSNIGADEIAARMGKDSFASWVNRFGFGRPTGVQLNGEQPGVILPVSRYSGVSMYNLPFGQGEEVTPMQMVQYYDAIANGGTLRAPQIVKSIGGRPQTPPRGTRVLSPTVAYELRSMLRGVLADGGTASGAAIPGYDLAGKTGTSQVVVNGKYSSTEFDSSFIGMVPASDPKLVVAVVVHNTGQYGGSIAAPAFQKIVGWAVPYFGINPCPAPCPASAYGQAGSSSP